MNAKAEDHSEITVGFHAVKYRAPNHTATAILSDITLEIRRGETVALLGRSGSGKPTDLVDPIRLRRGIGYVIQEGGLFPHYTVAENIGLVPGLEGWAPDRIGARVAEMMRLVGLDPGEYAGRKPRELSGGQRQRVGVARALAADPEILLMDEPFGALDPVTRAELQNEFADLARRLGKTILFVTHDLREAMRVGSRVVLLAAGKIVADARREEFLRVEHPEVRAFAASFAMPNEAQA